MKKMSKRDKAYKKEERGGRTRGQNATQNHAREKREKKGKEERKKRSINPKRLRGNGASATVWLDGGATSALVLDFLTLDS